MKTDYMTLQICNHFCNRIACNGNKRPDSVVAIEVEHFKKALGAANYEAVLTFNSHS